MESFPTYCKISQLGSRGTENIFMDEVEVTEKVDGCLKYDAKVLLPDGTAKKISEIVHNKSPIEVLSYNENTSQIESKPVIGWFKNSSANKFLKIDFKALKPNTKSYNTLNCTYNHPVKTIKGWVRADSLKIGDKILGFNRKLSEIQKQIILGILLGDGSIYCKFNANTAVVSFSHSEKQKDYFDKTVNLLENKPKKPYDFSHRMNLEE